MQSDRITVAPDGTGIEDALNQTEAVARFRNLTNKDALHLRLLTEEMMGVVRGIAGDVQMQYWIEDDQAPCHFALHLSSTMAMTAAQRNSLIQVSTSRKNSAAKGITGKIRDYFEQTLMTYEQDPSAYNALAFPELYAAAEDAYDLRWSMMQYRTGVIREQAPEAWDELEKSVVAKLADEITIGIRGLQVELTVYKTMTGAAG